MLGYTDVTPERATEILNHNTWNRDLKQSIVEQYARDMKAGNWRKNGATIVIATDQSLLDGQHRLWAIVESGVTVPMLLVKDADKDSVSTIDTGKGRTYADYKKLAGNATGNPVLYTTNLQAAVKLCYWYDNLWPKIPNSGNMKASHSELDEVLAQHPQFPDLLGDVMASGAIKRLRAGSQIALVYCLGAEKYPNEARAWLEGLKNADGAKTDPARFLRETLIAKALTGVKLDPPTKIVYAIKSWNAFAQGTSMGSLRWLVEEPPPAIFGTPQYTGSRAAHTALFKKKQEAKTQREKIAAGNTGKRRRVRNVA